MTNTEKDTIRTQKAAKEILDGREPLKDRGAILVTLEHLIATILLLAMGKDPKKAAQMLNEGVVDGVESRLARYANPGRRP